MYTFFPANLLKHSRYCKRSEINCHQVNYFIVMTQIFVLLLGAHQRSWSNYVVQNSNIPRYKSILTSGENLKPMSSPACLLITETIQKTYHGFFFWYCETTWPDTVTAPHKYSDCERLNCYKHQLCTQPNSHDWYKGYNFNIYDHVSYITLSPMKMFGITIFKCINTSNTKMSLFIQCTTKTYSN